MVPAMNRPVSTVPAFQSSLPTSFCVATTHALISPTFSTHRVPPPPKIRINQRRSPSPVIAWLAGNPSDSSVLAAATATSCRVVPVLGDQHVAANTAISAGAHTVYCHVERVPICLQLFRSRGLSVVPVGSVAPIPVPLLAAAAVPALLEMRDDTVMSYFTSEKDGTAALVQEEEIDTRSLLEKIKAWIIRVYLPQGFPDTTTPDYISFTKYRTLQNLASAIMSVISTEALLFGLGLGKKVAAGAAATSWVLKDGASYIAKILYGSIFGSKFDDDPKSWRIGADIVEDVGGAIEILTPLFPMRYFLPLASLAVCLRGMSLMTGTATRHVVYRSLAASGMQNTGDIATKGESQGVTMKMIGLGTGILVSSRIGQNYYALLAAYSALAAVHIAANWKSVQCVQFNFFNKQRASILIESHLKGDALPNPYDVSHIEKVILPPWRGFEPSVKIGARVTEAVKNSATLTETIRMFRGERFLIFTADKGSSVRVLLHPSATSMDTLRAYYTVKHCKQSAVINSDILTESLKYMKKNIKSFERQVLDAGWDTRHMLLTDDTIRVKW